MSILGVVGVLHHGEFLNRLHHRHVGEIVCTHLSVVGRAIQQEFIAFLPTAIDNPIGDGAVVEGALPDGCAAEGYAGCGQPQHEWIAAGVQRQVGHLLGVDQTGAAAALGVEQRGLAVDFHRLGEVAYFEFGVDSGHLADFQTDIVSNILLKACG